MALLRLFIYTRVRVVTPFVCANCVRVYTIERAYARAYICTCTCIHVSLRLFTCKNANTVSYEHLHACLHADLIKTQNAFAHKIFQHSNALWVQKLSGCTIVVRDFRLHHTCSIIILWLHSLSGVISSLLYNPHAFSSGIIIISVCAKTPP